MGIKEWKREKLVSAVMDNPNINEACEAIGLGPRQAQRILAQPETQELIREKLDAYAISKERTLREISLRAYSNIKDLLTFENGVPRYDLSNATTDQLAAIAEVRVDETGGSGDGERVAVRRVTIKMADQLKALEMLAKHLHLLDVRVELDVSDGLASRLGGARHRTIDATPEAAQVLIDTHSIDVVTNELTEDTDSTSTTDAVGTKGSTSTPSTTSTSLPPSPPPLGCVPHILAENLGENELTGIIADEAADSPAVRQPVCVFCSTHPCCCGTGL